MIYVCPSVITWFPPSCLVWVLVWASLAAYAEYFGGCVEGTDPE